jgi:hypothetical protein
MREDFESFKVQVLKQFKAVDTAVVKKSDQASLQSLQKTLMDLLHEHLTMIHSKVADLVKAKESLMKKEKVNREF